MAFVLVPHLDPGHASMLSEILQRNTTMPVLEVAGPDTRSSPDHVYIIPPNKDMAIFHGDLQLRRSRTATGHAAAHRLFLPVACRGPGGTRDLRDPLGQRVGWHARAPGSPRGRRGLVCAGAVHGKV